MIPFTSALDLIFARMNNDKKNISSRTAGLDTQKNIQHFKPYNFVQPYK